MLLKGVVICRVEDLPINRLRNTTVDESSRHIVDPNVEMDTREEVEKKSTTTPAKLLETVAPPTRRR